MDESTLAAKMLEMAKSDMKHVKSKGLLGENPNWKKSKNDKEHQKRGGWQGRPDSFRSKILERLELGRTTDEIMAELGCCRSIVNSYKRKWRLARDAASSQAA
ncbi:MAG: hypothetical protein ACPHL3_08210 [Paracoccaceae bacterium]